jgi:hypothetical protein
MDEGNADYFGYLATGDSGFFLCSFPTENRDLSVGKTFSADIVGSLQNDPNFDPHAGGAVWASIQFLIGQAIGAQENGRFLLKMMPQLLTCATSGGVLKMNFGTLARCHMQQADGASQSAMQSIYSQSLGSYAGSN